MDGVHLDIVALSPECGGPARPGPPYGGSMTVDNTVQQLRADYLNTQQHAAHLAFTPLTLWCMFDRRGR